MRVRSIPLQAASKGMSSRKGGGMSFSWAKRALLGKKRRRKRKVNMICFTDLVYHSHPGEGMGSLARIMYKLSTAVPYPSALTVLCVLGLLGVLQEYACGALRRTPCHRGACGPSSRQPMQNPGLVAGSSQVGTWNLERGTRWSKTSALHHNHTTSPGLAPSAFLWEN